MPFLSSSHAAKNIFWWSNTKSFNYLALIYWKQFMLEMQSNHIVFNTFRLLRKLGLEEDRQKRQNSSTWVSRLFSFPDLYMSQRHSECISADIALNAKQQLQQHYLQFFTLILRNSSPISV